MNDLENAACTECGGRIEPKLITQEFEREGTIVEVSGVRALVCKSCGEVYFLPGGAQAVAQAANSLFELARRNRQHKGKLAGKVKSAPKKRERASV